MHRLIVVCVLCVGVLTVGPAAQAHKGLNLTNLQIFEGLVFGQAPVTKLLGSAAIGLSGEQTRAIRVLERNIQRQHHQFFGEFASEVTSGDPGAVSGALKAAHRMLERFMRRSHEMALPPTIARGGVTAELPVGPWPIDFIPPIIIFVEPFTINIQKPNAWPSFHNLINSSFDGERQIAWITRALDGVAHRDR
ncbi:MAG: hypothetical protein JO233_01935 [Candidatus Eremiobacteraeota bacterium]|nr:hypothetical protein [Candidatus Eremiobacteraeota bacterium]